MDMICFFIIVLLYQTFISLSIAFILVAYVLVLEMLVIYIIYTNVKRMKTFLKILPLIQRKKNL